MMRTLLLIAAALAVSAISPVIAADADNGERLARRWCAFCHVVAPDQRRAAEGPPFSEIARKPGLNAAQLALFLLAPHPKMPDMGLSRGEAADLAEYIVRQR
jgi:mono/diheme cytochrome c family protein